MDSPMHPETSPSLPQEVYQAQLLDRESKVIAAGHVRITGELRGAFEKSLLDEPAQIAKDAVFLSWGTFSPRRLKSLRYCAGMSFGHFDFVLEA